MNKQFHAMYQADMFGKSSSFNVKLSSIFCSYFSQFKKLSLDTIPTFLLLRLLLHGSLINK